jgi:hypothetical protein
MFKKLLKSSAIIVVLLSAGNCPVTFAAAITESDPRTACAFLRFLLTLGEKLSRPGTVGKKLKIRARLKIINIAKLPLIKNIKITGIKASVTLNDKITATAA